MKLILLALGLCTAVLSQTYDDSADSIIKEIQAKAKTWTPGFNERFRGVLMSDIKNMMGTKDKTGVISWWEKLFGMRWPQLHYGFPAIPDTFDSRTQWPKCKLLTHIRDQGNCGGCWAVSSAEVATDRTCIATDGKVDIELSAEDLLSCCSFCGYGCQGGFPYDAMKFWKNDGLVTGGDYGSKQGCQPYTISKAKASTPSCSDKCEAGYTKSFNDDKYHAKTAFYIEGGAKGMQTEIMKNGPIVATFSVYEDFMHYKSGVYQHVTGNYLGGHAVKIIGWGTENNVDYWLVANQWSTSWGDQGYFKIRRGNNECGFDSGSVAGEAQ